VETYDLKQQVENTNALNVSLRSFTPLCFLRVLATDYNRSRSILTLLLEYEEKHQNVALEE